MMESRLADWPYIPEAAFLYFPENEKIKEGSGENQWRKIFYGVPYDYFEIQHLNKLNNKLVQQNVQQPHPWFDEANKLRFLQGNKFKIVETVNAIKQAINWRNTNFPLQINSQIQMKLNQGSMYICGRDSQYRPIIVVQVLKIKKYDPQLIPIMLSALFQFAINEMMIEGQIQNYILLINLNGSGIGDKNSIKRIISFNSSTYRSRVYLMYLLNTPMLIAAGWDAFASTFIPQSSIKKIRLTKKNQHQNMWTHLNKNDIQQKYGGKKSNKISHFWPPLSETINEVKSQSKHISIDEYINKFKQGKLNGRKNKSSLIPQNLLRSKISHLDNFNNNTISEPQYQNQKQKSLNISKISSNQSSPHKKSLNLNKQKCSSGIQYENVHTNNPQSLTSPVNRLTMIQNQINPQSMKYNQEEKLQLRKRNFDLFFQHPKFQKMRSKLKQKEHF